MENEPYIADITIDRSRPEPLHTQIAEPLAQLIESGELPPGTRIEDEMSMAARLHVSRPTARRAFETLTKRGLVIRRRGIGTSRHLAKGRAPACSTGQWKPPRQQ
ncbi:MAG: GntR family transcriptional regulator [Cutibacterium acnes]|nr:GntR family transcriptional regulator [Cutibacterium acnes]